MWCHSLTISSRPLYTVTETSINANLPGQVVNIQENYPSDSISYPINLKNDWHLKSLLSQTLLGHDNKGNDHQLEKQILPVIVPQKYNIQISMENMDTCDRVERIKFA